MRTGNSRSKSLFWLSPNLLSVCTNDTVVDAAGGDGDGRGGDGGGADDDDSDVVLRSSLIRFPPTTDPVCHSTGEWVSAVGVTLGGKVTPPEAAVGGVVLLQSTCAWASDSIDATSDGEANLVMQDTACTVRGVSSEKAIGLVGSLAAEVSHFIFIIIDCGECEY